MSSWFRSTPQSEEMLEQERLVVAATEAIAEAMERRGVNKAQLAGLLEVRPSEISQRLSGKRNLTLKSLAAMLHALGVRARISIQDESERFVARDPWTGTNVLSQRADVGPMISHFVLHGQMGTHDWSLPAAHPIGQAFGQVRGANLGLNSSTHGLPDGVLKMIMQPSQVVDGAATVLHEVPDVAVE